MAGKVKGHTLLRKIHFYAAALSATFLLLFFITGYLLGKYQWFDHTEAEPRVQTLKVEVPAHLEDWELGRWAKAASELTGKVDWVNKNRKGEWSVEIVTPRLNHLIKIPPNRDQLTIESRPTNGYEMVVALHRMHRYGGGLLYDCYLVGMDLASVSLLLFSITGIYLWLGLVRRKWLGWLVLVLGFGYTVLVVVSWFIA